MSTAARRTPSHARCAHAIYRKIFRMIKGHLRQDGNNITRLSNILPAKNNFKGQCDDFSSSYYRHAKL